MDGCQERKRTARWTGKGAAGFNLLHYDYTFDDCGEVIRGDDGKCIMRRRSPAEIKLLKAEMERAQRDGRALEGQICRSMGTSQTRWM